jgi:hypothetical protein
LKIQLILVKINFIKGTLFRANSTASKLMKSYCGRIAAPFLQKCIGKLVDDICDNPVNFEIDPLKCKDKNEIEKNIENLMNVTKSFLDAILNSIEYCPTSLRKYCKFLYESVGEKFKKQNDDVLDPSEIAVGGFYFLRLFNPAIINPGFLIFLLK